MGNLYGVVYPIMDSLLALEIIALYALVSSFDESKSTKAFTVKARKVFFVFAAIEVRSSEEQVFLLVFLMPSSLVAVRHADLCRLYEGRRA